MVLGDLLRIVNGIRASSKVANGLGVCFMVANGFGDVPRLTMIWGYIG